MPKDTHEAYLPPREKLVAWLARLYRHRLTTTTGGNLSFIDDDGVLYITPSGGDKALIPPSDVTIHRPGSVKFEGIKAPSMEWRLHTSAYSARPDCRAVLHAHSMALIAFSLAIEKNTMMSQCFQIDHPGIPDTRCLFSAWMTCGRVRFAPYSPPGSDQLAAACANMLSQADCVILQNHGVVTIGSSLQEAYDRFVSLENLALTIINSLPIGVPRPLKKSILDMKEERNVNYQKFLRSVSKCTHVYSCCSLRTVTGCEKEARSELCSFVERAYKHNIFTSSSGSISIRLPSSTDTNQSEIASYLITPTNIDRRDINPRNICFLSNLDCCERNNCCAGESDKSANNSQEQSVKPVLYHPNQRDVLPSHASEIHQTIYNMHPEVNSIVIAQPPYATAFCITGEELNAAGIPESHLVLGDVKTLPFDCLENSGLALSRTLDPPHGISTVLVNGFGLLSVATTPLKAYMQVEVCESICGVMLTAMRRGPPTLLTNEQVKEIDVIFKDGH